MLPLYRRKQPPGFLKEWASYMLQEKNEKQNQTNQPIKNNNKNSIIVRSAFSRDFGPKVFEPLKTRVFGVQSLGVLSPMGTPMMICCFPCHSSWLPNDSGRSFPVPVAPCAQRNRPIFSLSPEQPQSLWIGLWNGQKTESGESQGHQSSSAASLRSVGWKEEEALSHNCCGACVHSSPP